ncbi:MAG: lysophospholipid acyltransferase family protein [Puniceicoccales bacterium]|jgi:putative hemolysin|nr:lysophospholipid acyltransferase family protein [Puniceicoccales bacterium]
MIPSEPSPPLIDFSRSIANPFLRALWKFGAPLMEGFLGVTALNRCYKLLQRRTATGEDFFTAAMHVLGLTYAVEEEDLERIPQNGPLFVVSNHPFGAADGIILSALLSRTRADFRLLANSLLCHMEGIRPWMFPVNPFGGTNARRENLRAMHSALQHLQNGGCLATFPSGEVSSFRWEDRHVADPPWNAHIARMARQAQATVLPVYFHGRNSNLFQCAGLVHARARTLLLMRELVNKRGQLIRLRIGNPLVPGKLVGFESDQAMTEFLRLGTYALHDDNHDGAAIPHSTPTRIILPRRTPQQRIQSPIIPAISPNLIHAEIESLPPSAKLTENGTFTVYIFHGNELPHTLREIGRLREVTFRAVSEGTGKPCDLDEFDNHYEHLLLYDTTAPAIAGAYRLGRTDAILESRGKQGLYTSTLFHFRSGFFMKLNPAIELGRSFITPEYQRRPSCLPLLWRGICGYIARYPRYGKLFGPVSINPEYNAFSRRLILEFLKKNNVARDLASYVRAKNPPRRIKLRGTDLAKLLEANFDVDDLSAMVSGLESDNKPVPVLLKHYLRLNGQMIAFNIDPAFGECLDGLIVVDVLKVDPKLLRAYMGPEGLKNYFHFHGQKTPENTPSFPK